MAFWVTGRDAVSGEPERMLSDAATAEEALAQARAQGLVPDRAEPAPAPERAPARPPRREALPGWFQIGVGVALLGSCAYRIGLNAVHRGLGGGDLATTVVIGLYLVVPALLIWSGARALAGHRWLGRPKTEQAADYDDQGAAEPGAAADPRRPEGSAG